MKRIFQESTYKSLATSGGVTVSKLDLQTYMSEFESHWAPHSFGLVPRRSKVLCKLLLTNPPEIIDNTTEKIINGLLDIKQGQFTMEELDVVLTKVQTEKLQASAKTLKNMEDKKFWRHTLSIMQHVF